MPDLFQEINITSNIFITHVCNDTDPMSAEYSVAFIIIFFIIVKHLVVCIKCECVPRTRPSYHVTTLPLTLTRLSYHVTTAPNPPQPHPEHLNT